MFVTRDVDGKINGAYRRLQTKEGSNTEPLFEQEEIADDDADLIAFFRRLDDDQGEG